jgi:polar amino acid transport system substrate-binding protein
MSISLGGGTMLRTILISGIALAALSHTVSAEVRFGVAAEPYPPFTAKSAEGKWEGWEVDLIDAICIEMKETCKIEEVAWDGIIPALNAKKFDAIAASMVINNKRKEIISFSDMYYGGAFTLVGSKSSMAGEMSGKTIAVQAASVNADYAEKHFTPNGADVKAYPTQDDAQADLAAGRVDFVLGNAIVLDMFLASDAGKACCLNMGAVPPDTELGGEVGFGVRKDDEELRQKLNAAIKSLAASGKIDEIAVKWNLTGKIILPPK